MKKNILYVFVLAITAIPLSFKNDSVKNALAKKILRTESSLESGREMSKPESEKENPEPHIDSLYSAINSWTYGFLFRLKRAFENQNDVGVDWETLGKYFQNEFASVDRFLQNGQVPRKLAYQLRFVKFMLRTIYDSSYMVKFLSLKDAEREMITRIGHQIIGLMDLHDGFGNPDPSRQSFEDGVAHSKVFFTHWKNIVDKSIELPESLRSFIQNQIKEALYIISVLGTCIPREESAGDPLLVSPSITLEITYY